MALKISKDSAKTNLVSTNGAMTNPVTTTHPTTGSTVETKLYLFNDNATMYYTGITIDPTDSSSPDESSWIYLAPDNAGVAGTYGAASAALSMANIGAAGSGDTTVKPFWMKVVVPPGQGTQNKSDLRLTVNFTETAV